MNAQVKVTFTLHVHDFQGNVALDGEVTGMKVPTNTQIVIYKGAFPTDPNDSGSIQDWVWLQDAPPKSPYKSNAPWGPGWNVAIAMKSQETDGYIYVVQGTTPAAPAGFTKSASFTYGISSSQETRSMELNSFIQDSGGNEVGDMAPVGSQLVVYEGDFPTDSNTQIKSSEKYQNTPFSVEYGGRGWNVGLSCLEPGLENYTYIVKGTTECS